MVITPPFFHQKLGIVMKLMHIVGESRWKVEKEKVRVALRIYDYVQWSPWKRVNCWGKDRSERKRRRTVSKIRVRDSSRWDNTMRFLCRLHEWTDRKTWESFKKHSINLNFRLHSEECLISPKFPLDTEKCWVIYVCASVKCMVNCMWERLRAHLHRELRTICHC